MIKKEIVINASISGTRIAILEGGRLAELYIELPEQERMVGNIYKGVVENVIKGMGAGFVDIGMNQNSFLRFSDIGEFFQNYGPISSNGPAPKRRGRGRDNGVPLISNQEILVQITKEPIGTKGARVTSEIAIPGRFLVLLPGSGHVGVSRKIGNTRERNRLKRLMLKMKEKGFGVIIRTVAAGKSADVLRSDLQNLMRTWERIEQKAKREKGPLILYKDMGMVSSIIRDLFTSDVSRVVVDSRKLYREISRYLKEVSSDLREKVEHYRGVAPLFDKVDVEKDVEKCLSRRVWLKTGGYIVIDQAEALVAIDVNSGKHVGRSDHDETSLKINLEASQEIAKQLRLRDLGGLIVIDFIDMTHEARRKKLINHFRREIKRDRAKTSISDISNFGLVEMTRERIRPSVIYSFTETCQTCDGIGLILSSPTVATQIEHAIRRLRSNGRERSIKLVVNPILAEYLSEGMMNRLRKIMIKYFVRIQLVPDKKIPYGEFQMISKKTDKDLAEAIKT